MTDTTDPEHRSFTSPASDAIEFRQPEDEDGVFDVRMPIATTGEVRNQGDDPLTRDELEGMARQIEERNIGVFLDHGGTDLGGMERYSAVEKIGEWREAEVQTREADDESELVATARLMDPETLPNGVSKVREAVGAIKEQVKRGFSVSASIGWREDSSYPGGNDLMEASIVGIGADPRTTSEASTAVVARAAVDAGADPDDLIREVRKAVREESDPDESRPFGPPGGDPNEWEDFDDCVSDVEDWDNIDDPQAFCAWAEAQAESADEPPDADDGDEQDSHDMSESEDTPDEGDTTEDEQQSDEPDEEQAPELGEPMLESAEAFADALDEYGVEEVYESVTDLLRQDDDEEEDEDDDMEEEEMDEDEEEDEEDEQTADEPDAEQDADDSDLEERIASLEDELQAFRNGDLEPDTPETDDEQDADTDEQRDADKPSKAEKYGLYQ